MTFSGKYRRTPLIVDRLLWAGANRDLVANNGDTALDLACAHGHAAAARLLLAAGASFGHVNEGGHTPLMIACFEGCTACARLLLKAGASANLAVPERGDSPLLIACERGHHACVLDERAGDHVAQTQKTKHVKEHSAKGFKRSQYVLPTM